MRHGSSALAICHSLLLKALPGLFVCVGIAALSDGQLAASAGQGGLAHVKIVFDKPVPAMKRPAELTAPALHMSDGSLSGPGLPSADLKLANIAAATTLVPAMFEHLAQLAIADSHIAALDFRSKFNHVEGALDGVRLQGAAFWQSTQVAVASAFEDRPLVVTKSDQPDGTRLFVAPPEARATYAVADRQRPSPSLESFVATMSSPRIDYVPFMMGLETSELLVTWAAETKLASASSPPVLDQPLAARISASRTALDAGDFSYSGGGSPAPLMPAEDLPTGMVMPRPEDLESAAVPPPVRDAQPLRLADLPAGSGSDGEAHLSPTYPFEAGPADILADRTLSAADPILGEEDRRGGFDTQTKPVSEDFGAGLTLALSGPVGSAPGLNGATDSRDNLVLDGSALVQLKTLVEMLSDRFEASEWERISSSRAIEAYVPVSKLKAAGIPFGPDQLARGFTAVHATSGNAGSGVTQGIAGNGFFGTTQSVAATASAGFDNNPFLAPGGQSTAAASTRLQLAPTITRKGERTNLRLSGRLEHIEYLGQYDSLQNYGADFAVSHRANERVALDGGLLFSSDNLATNLANPFFSNDPAPGTSVPPVGNDITVLGQQQRRTLYGANAGLNYTLSERDELRWTLNARAERFGSNGLTDSDFLSQQLRYSRQVNEGLAIGAIVDASLINFSDAAFGNAKTVTPQLFTTISLSPRFTLSGAVGLAITRIELGGLEETNTALSGNLSLCREGERSNLCINGSRQVLPSAIGGARVQTTGGLSYSFRLSERDSLRINGSYSTASEPLAVAGGDFESINGSVRFERQLDERFRLFVSGGYLNASGNLQANASNYQALVGIVFNLGNSR